MKIKLDALKKAVQDTSVVAGQMNVSMAAVSGSDQIALSAANGAFAVFSYIDGVNWEDENGVKPMSIEVNANLLRSSLSHFSGTHISIKKTPKVLCLSSEDEAANATLRLPFADNGIPESIGDCSDEKYACEVVVKHLTSYISRTAHALSSLSSNGGDAKRSSFYLETDGKNICVTATDGYRISMRSGAVGKIKRSFILPGAEMKSILPMIDDDGTVFRIPAGDQRHLQIKTGNVIILMPVIDGIYYNVKNVIDNIENDIKTTVTVDRLQLISSCEMGGLIDSKVIFSIKPEAVSISAAGQLGETIRTLPASVKPNVSLQVAFSDKFMIDALKSVTTQMVDIRISGANGICEVLPHNTKNMSGRTVEIVLPVSTKRSHAS